MQVDDKMLLPCPFCGGEMENRGYGAIHVDGQGCPIGDHAIAVDKWNRRLQNALDTIDTIDTIAINFIRDNGMKTIHDLVEVARSALVASPAQEAVTAELLAEHSGCGGGIQVEQVTAKLAPGDAVYVVRGKIGQALLVPKSDRIITLYATPPAVQDGMVTTHRHKKRGTEYALIGIGKMQTDFWEERGEGTTERPAPAESVDMREVAVYRSVDDGSLWVRPREEFEDGRFEPITAAQEGR